LRNRSEGRNLRSEPTPVASGAVERVAIYESLVCAASVFASWRSRDKSPALLSLVGNVIADFQLPISNFGFQSAIGNWQLKMEF
jgi:hypothetical protein